MFELSGKAAVAAGALVAFILLFVSADKVGAAIYWGNSDEIGRVDIDYSDFEPGFISLPPSSNACGIAVNQSHIFWADSSGGTIGRANIDGTDPELAFIGGAVEPCGVAVDESYIYWANRGADTIGRARLDGTEVDHVFIVGVQQPCSVAVNKTHIFWGSVSAPEIGRATIDGKVTPFVTIKNEPVTCGVAVDERNVYWQSSHIIGSVELDGTNPQLLQFVNKPCGVGPYGSQIYWIEEGFGSGLIANGNLDGRGGGSAGINNNLDLSCGIAVDSLETPPVVPEIRPPEARCGVVKVHIGKHRGIAIVTIFGDAFGDLRLQTKGLAWRVLNDPPPGRIGRMHWRYKVWPKSRGAAGKRIRRQLGRNGHARVMLRVRCIGEEAETIPRIRAKPITLRRIH